jgi:hypothetical protein
MHEINPLLFYYWTFLRHESVSQAAASQSIPSRSQVLPRTEVAIDMIYHLPPLTTTKETKDSPSWSKLGNKPSNRMKPPLGRVSSASDIRGPWSQTNNQITPLTENPCQLIPKIHQPRTHSSKSKNNCTPNFVNIHNRKKLWRKM